MRFSEIDTISFTDVNGNEFPVKDLRPLKELTTGETIDVAENMFIDEVISRTTKYGDDTEDLTYLVVDHNAEKLVEHGFDLSKLKKLKIPIITEK